MIARIGYNLSWSSLRELVDTGLEPGELEDIRDTILSVGGVKNLWQDIDFRQDATDFDIFDVGSWRSITRAPVAGVTASGITNVPSPKRWLKRMAMSRVISTCWR